MRRKHHLRRQQMETTAPITGAEWESIVKRQKGRCFYCRMLCPLTMDHLLPLNKGGQHEAVNIVGACRPCNSKKADRLLPVALLATPVQSG